MRRTFTPRFSRMQSICSSNSGIEYKKVAGFTLVEIMIVVTIIALLAAIAIPNLLRQRILANESRAQATLKAISTAFETFAAANNGQYPTDVVNQLVGAPTPYLSENYFTQDALLLRPVLAMCLLSKVILLLIQAI